MKHIAIIGGGVVGVATLEALSQQAPYWQLSLLEKEPSLATHQSGRNSGVIHSGLYYKPGSLKARFCRQGKRMLEIFCREQGIRFEIRGKLIAAFDENQEEVLAELLERGRANVVDCRLLTSKEIKEIEPRLEASNAIEVPGTGIVDYGQVTDRLAQLASQRGSQIFLNRKLTGIIVEAGGVSLQTNNGKLRVDGYINCAGLQSDRIARLAGVKLAARIIPFRGEYYRLKQGSTENLSGRLLYPSPDPRVPFLGVHITPTLSGEFICGPNAVLALAREGYRWRNINLRYLWRLMTYSGFLRLAGKQWRFGFREFYRSLSKQRFSDSVGSLIAGVSLEDLERAGSGVRAQLVTRQGELVDDFLIDESPNGLHLLNAPSPAATASLRIGEILAQRAVEAFS